MKIPDNVLIEFFRLATDIDINVAEKLIKEDIIEAHKVFAREIIRMYHGEEFIKEAEDKYAVIAKGEIPEDIENVVEITENENICDVIVKANFATSRGEAKRLIQGNGVKINNEVIQDINLEISKDSILKCGKNKFAKIIIK